jgi:hypothetical protein
MVQDVITRIKDLPEFTATALETAIREAAEKLGQKLGNLATVAHPFNRKPYFS